MRKKKGICLMLAVVMAISTGFTALAADTKIDTVKLTFSYDKAPASGDDIGNLKVKADSREFYVESAEYTNSDDQDTWTVGDVPEVKIELSAKDGYRFSYTSKSHFKFTGCNAEFKKAKIYDSGAYIEAVSYTHLMCISDSSWIPIMRRNHGIWRPAAAAPTWSAISFLRKQWLRPVQEQEGVRPGPTGWWRLRNPM